MKPRKFFQEDLLNLKRRASCANPASGTKEIGPEHFGGDNSPHFGGLAALGKDDRGVAMIEYAVLCAAIALVILVALTRLGGNVGANWNDVNDEVGHSIEFKT